MRPFSRPCLMLVTEPSPRLPQIVSEAVAGGVDIVQWRDKTTPQEELHRQVRIIKAATSPALLVVNGPPALARADGRHLAGSDASVRFLRHRCGYPKLIGRSVHAVDEAQEAAEAGADYLVAGTIFASQSHSDVAPAGLGFLRAVCAAVAIPVLAIGGVTPENAGACLEAGAAGVAVLSPIMRAKNPKSAVQAYRTALDEAWEKNKNADDN